MCDAEANLRDGCLSGLRTRGARIALILSLLGVSGLFDGCALKRKPATAQNHALAGLRPPLQAIERDVEREMKERRAPGSAYTDALGAQKYFAQKRVPDGETAIPVQKYFAALERMREMPQFSTRSQALAPPRAVLDEIAAAALLGTWVPLGPGNIGGRTRALLIDPVTPSTMYAAGVAGGVWKTTNGGTSWTPLTDLIANIAVNSMAMDPSNRNIIYAGTGEGYFNIDEVRGAGIFKTTDAGASWTRLASTNNSNFYYVNDIIASPNNPLRVYAATGAGILRSLDGGSTWSLTPSALTGGCLDLAIRTDQATDYLFASCGTFTQASIMRNTDAGGAGAWTTVYTESNMGRTSLAIAPSNQNIIYALSSSIQSGSQYLYGLHAVFRSTSSGDPGSWSAQVRNTNPTKLNTVLLTNPIFAFLTDCNFGTSNAFFNQGWYDNVIAVDPLDPNRVWVGGIDLFRSDDGGMNWGLASYWWASKTVPQFAHADNHVIVFHPQYDGTTNRIMFAGNDGGLFRTNDARSPTATGPLAPCNPINTSVNWTELNNNYGVTQFYHGLPYPGGTTYFGGTQDNGTVRSTDVSGSENWTEILGGDGGYVAVDPSNPNIIYAENTGISIQKSTNGGSTFTSATSGISDPGGLFINPFIMDPSSSQRLWTGGWYLWRTTNAAGNWVRASALTPGFGSVSAIAVAPTNANRVLAGMSDGYLLRTDIGLTSNAFTNWSSNRPRTGYVSWIAVDPSNADVIYATYSTFGGGAHVWKSSSGGASWVGIDGTGNATIPDIPVHSIVVDSTDPLKLYVGTDLGVFTTQDGGNTWEVEVSGFANVITEALAFGTRNGVQNLYAFTHGRGAWRVPFLPPPPANDSCAGALTIPAAPFSHTVNAAGATMQVDDPTPGCGNGSRNQSIWYRFTPPENGIVTANTAGSNYNTILAAFTGSCGAFTPVSGGCNNGGSPQSQVSFQVVAGTTYSFMVSSFNNDAVTLFFNMAYCPYYLAPRTHAFGSAGGNGSVGVFSPAGCTWTATSNVVWVNITSSNSGNGGAQASVTFSVGANSSTSPRTGTITIAGQAITIDQAGATNCSYSIVPTSASFSVAGGTGNVSVTTAVGCAWTAVSNAAWISITSGSSSSGPGIVGYSVSANPGPGPRVGTMTIAGQTFTVNQTDTGAIKAQVLTPVPNTTLLSSTVLFTWSTGVLVSRYWLWIGTYPTGSDVYNQDQGTNLSANVSRLPANGNPLYVRLWSLINGTWDYNQYTYTAFTSGTGVPAQITSPVSGSTLGGASQQFTWNTGTSVTQYWLEIGSSQGGNDLYDANQVTGTSVTVSGLPTDGRMLYARLWSLISGNWQFNDYTYTAATVASGKAAITSPTPGSTLPSSTVNFIWNSGTGVSQYWLYIGNAPGASDIYSANQVTNLSVNVTGLPADGRTLYVRLWSLIGAVWELNDYTYTAATITGANVRGETRLP